MAYSTPADTATHADEIAPPEDQACSNAPTPAPSTPTAHRRTSTYRPVRVVSMVDGPQGKEVLCEFPNGWQRSISLPTEADAWHPLFDGLPQEQTEELREFARPAAYVDANGVRKRRDGLSFTTDEVGRNGGCKKARWFDVPDEEYGVGQITGYRAAAEMLEALQRGYGPRISVGPILGEVFSARKENYRGPSRRGAASAFTEVLNEALMFFATNARHGPWLDGKVAKAERTNAWFAEQEIREKTAFVQRMKEAKAAKKAARQGVAA